MNPQHNAGWFPDPAGQLGQRYFDGQNWTEHFAPYPPPYPAPQPVAVAVSHGGPNHALHAVLTLFTCGLWLPIWILVAIFSSSSRSSVAVAGPGGVVSTPPNRKPLIVVGVLLGLIVLRSVIVHPWLLAVLVAIIAIGGLIWWMRNDAQKRKRLAADADYEDRLYYEGDPRGTYGRYMPPQPFQDGGALIRDRIDTSGRDEGNGRLRGHSAHSPG